jgi:Mlc titration factor MtfA (ptsG expression regulator)
MRRLLRRYPIPHHLWQRVTRRVLVLNNLDAVEMAHLRELATWFLHRKSIIGVQGLEVTSSMKVAVAAQACLLILNLEVAYFDGWIEVILYPGAFRVDHAQMDAIGLVNDGMQDLSGEAWLRGPVILSWSDVERDTYRHNAGHNVVMHEFAHKLDGIKGVTNGMPPLRRGMSRKNWAKDLGAAYKALCLRLAAGKGASINAYAATSPAEFFAVVSEYFFTAPDILKDTYPSVHKQLIQFYRQQSSR